MVFVWLTLGGPALAETPAPPDCTALEGDDRSACERANEVTAVKAELTTLGDCSTLEGEAHATCLASKGQLEARLAELQPPVPEKGKGGKAKRSDTNRLELDVTDE